MGGIQFFSITNEDAMNICVSVLGIRCTPTPSAHPRPVVAAVTVNIIPCLFSKSSEQILYNLCCLLCVLTEVFASFALWLANDCIDFS